jgi:hypothetical protein
MFYKFNVNGLYIGTSETEVPYSTSVAPPDDASQKWIWNHVGWVGMPTTWEYVMPDSVVLPVPPAEEPTPDA